MVDGRDLTRPPCAPGNVQFFETPEGGEPWIDWPTQDWLAGLAGTQPAPSVNSEIEAARQDAAAAAESEDSPAGVAVPDLAWQPPPRLPGQPQWPGTTPTSEAGGTLHSGAPLLVTHAMPPPLSSAPLRITPRLLAPPAGADADASAGLHIYMYPGKQPKPMWAGVPTFVKERLELAKTAVQGGPEKSLIE